MDVLVRAILSALSTALQAIGRGGSPSEHAWRIYLSALLGVFFAYTLVKLFDSDPYQIWPYIIGLTVGTIYGTCWHLRSSD